MRSIFNKLTGRRDDKPGDKLLADAFRGIEASMKVAEEVRDLALQQAETQKALAQEMEEKRRILQEEQRAAEEKERQRRQHKLEALNLVPGKDEEAAPPLWQAIDDMNPEAALRLLEQGADPFYRSPQGETLLMRATYGGQIEVMTALIARGLDVNAVDNGGRTALHRTAYAAADLNTIAAAQCLIDNGAYIDARDRALKTTRDFARQIDGAKAALIEYLDAAEKSPKTQRAAQEFAAFHSGAAAPLAGLRPIRFKASRQTLNS